MIKILIWVYKSRPSRRGMLPLYVRITVNKEREQFATGIEVETDKWSAKKQRIKGRSSLIKAQNETLNKIKSDLLTCYNELNEVFNNVTAYDVKQNYQKVPVPSLGLLAVLEEYIDLMKTLVDKDYRQSTIQLYSQSMGLIREFIARKWNHKDIRLDRLKRQFGDDLIHYLKTEKSYEQSTIQKVIQRLNTVMNYAVEREYLQTNPFTAIKVKKQKKEIVYLTMDEIKSIESQEFSIKRLEYIRDLMVFQLYTAIDYSTLKNLSYKHIRREGNEWVVEGISRQKTGAKVFVPLLPQAFQVLNKYREYTLDMEKKVFRVPANNHYNQVIKQVVEICGVAKHITSHSLRKSFASSIALANGVPLMTISKLLSHSSTSVTELSYASLSNDKLRADMEQLGNRLIS